jgi:hypothetical protein
LKARNGANNGNAEKHAGKQPRTNAGKKMDANTKTTQDDMKTNQTKTDVNLKEIKSGQAEMRSIVNAWLSDMKNIRKETMACLEKTEARLEVEEPTSMEMKPEVADEEVPLEDAARMPVAEPKKRCRDGNLNSRRHRKQQKWTQSKNGCPKNWVAARRGTTRRAVVARRRMLLTEETRGYCGSLKRVIAVYRKMPCHATVAWRKRHIRSAVETATQSRAAREESTVAPGKRQGNEGSMRQAAAIPEKEEDYRN